jgi:signal transduction histidine kinase
MTGIPDKKINSGYIIAFLLLLIAYFLIFFTIQQLIRETGIISRSYLFLNRLQSLKAEVSDAETGVRGYVITNDVNYLKSYNSATRNIPPILSDLKELIPENPEQKQSYATMDEMVNRRMNSLSQVLKMYQMNGYRLSEEFNGMGEAGRNTMDSIRVYINRMNEVENHLMSQRKTKLSRFFSDTKSMAIVSLMITLFAIFYSWLTYKQENRARQIAGLRAEEYRLDLERNIKELKQANIALDELKSIEKFAATGRIARTIAHEVRNPLTNISLAAGQIKEMNENPDARLLLEMVSRNADRINQLVSELLNATRFGELDFKLASVNELLDEALGMAGDRIRLNNISVEKEYTNEPCQVMVDTEKIKLAFLNIIVNGIEAMEKNKGHLQVKTSKAGDKCIVEIKDNGSGMDEETLQKLFDPYFTRKSSGNGLGMTNTQNIILNHKGNIKAYSKPDQGTSFVISLNTFNS